jgi:hypothetical protein
LNSLALPIAIAAQADHQEAADVERDHVSWRRRRAQIVHANGLARSQQRLEPRHYRQQHRGQVAGVRADQAQRSVVAESMARTRCELGGRPSALAGACGIVGSRRHPVLLTLTIVSEAAEKRAKSSAFVVAAPPRRAARCRRS